MPWTRSCGARYSYYYFGWLLKSLGIEGKSFHCLRHTFATIRRDAGESIDKIRLAMGHTSGGTTEGYTHRGDGSVRSR